MTSGTVELSQLKPINFEELQTSALRVEEAVLLKRSRSIAAKLLTSARKEKKNITARFEKEGLQKGTFIGRQEASRKFCKSSSDIRSYKKHLEQQLYETVEASMIELLSKNSEVLKALSKQILNAIKKRIRSLTLLKVKCHPSFLHEIKEYRSSEQKEFEIECSNQTQEGLLIFITPAGSLEVNAKHLLSDEVVRIFKKFCKQAKHDQN